MPTARRPRSGPPRKADHRTGASPEFARAIAGQLPAVEAKKRRGSTSFSVSDHVFLTVDDDETATVAFASSESEPLLLNRTGRDEVRSTIEDAWCSFAPKRQVTVFRKRQQARAEQPAATHADIRRIACALPRVNEGPIWGSDVGFRIGDDKKTRFARFGPPVGSRVSNLLPPDDEDTFVLLKCPERPALLESRADLYFTTPHYGAPGEPGGVIVRLCEVRGQAELQELADLIEDAWRAAGGG